MDGIKVGEVRESISTAEGDAAPDGSLAVVTERTPPTESADEVFGPDKNATTMAENAAQFLGEKAISVMLSTEAAKATTAIEVGSKRELLQKRSTRWG